MGLIPLAVAAVAAVGSSMVAKNAAKKASAEANATKVTTGTVTAPTAGSTAEIVSSEQNQRRQEASRKGYLSTIYGGDTGGFGALGAGQQNKLG